MLDSHTLEKRIAAQRTKEGIVQIEKALESITARFANPTSARSVEEQLAHWLEFLENRKRFGELNRQLLRLVCT